MSKRKDKSRIIDKLHVSNPLIKNLSLINPIYIKIFVRETINKRFSQQIVATDDLNRRNYATNIAIEIDKNQGKFNEGYIIAISGKWGEGKTRILEFLTEELRSKNYLIVNFNPWQFSQDEETLRRVFLKTTKKDLSRIELKDLTKDNLRSLLIFKKIKLKFLSLKKLDQEETGTSFNYKFIAIIFSIICFIVLVGTLIFGWVNLKNDLINLYKSNSNLIKISTGLLALLIGPQLIQIQRKNSKISSIDEFRTLFDKCLHSEKIVFLIDDLDRCTPSGIKLVLDTLKTFFSTKKGSYVVTGDHTIIESSIGNELDIIPIYSDGVLNLELNEQAKRIEGKRYLQKMFNIYWKLPQLDPTEAKRFTKNKLHKLSDINASQQENILNQIATSIDKNLRELSRFINLLEFCMSNIHSQISILRENPNKTLIEKSKLNSLIKIYSNPDLISKVLIIQEKFPVEFEYFSAQPLLFSELEKEVLTGMNGGVLHELEQRSRLYRKQFLSLVNSQPYFYNRSKFSVEYSPEMFFYYSGFTGEVNIGLTEDGILQRYIIKNEDLTNEIKSLSAIQAYRVIASGINNLVKLSDAPEQLNNAIDNLINLLTKDDIDQQDSLINLLDSPKFKETYSTYDDNKKDLIVNYLSDSIFKKRHIDLFENLNIDGTYADKKLKIWSKYNTGLISKSEFQQIIEILKKDIQNGVDITDVRRLIYNQLLEVIINPNNFSLEQYRISVFNFINYDDLLKINEFISENTFKDLIIIIKSKNISKEYKLEIFKILNRENSIWKNALDNTSYLSILKSVQRNIKKEFSNEIKLLLLSWK